MNTNNPLIGQFYFGFKSELCKIVAQVNKEHMLVEFHEGPHQPVLKRVVPLARLIGFVLYPTLQEAVASMDEVQP